MTTQTPSTPLQVLQALHDAYNARDPKAFASLLHDNVEYEEIPIGVQTNDHQAIVQAAFQFVTAFPDAKGTIVQSITEGEWITAEVEFTGTHQGAIELPGLTLPATGRPFRGRGAQVAQVADGKLLRMRYYYDILSSLRPLGARLDGPASE